MAQPPLTPELLITAYAQGIYPMARSAHSRVIDWYSPDPRAILPLDGLRVSRSLARTLRRGRFEIRFDAAFEEVMRACGSRASTWINEEMVRAYVGLHDLGLAHSVEAWQGGELVGGLYGVALGGAFMGESMFSRVSDASKVCLVALVRHLRERGFVLLDCQTPTEHLMGLGQITIPRDAYLSRLRDALRLDPSF